MKRIFALLMITGFSLVTFAQDNSQETKEYYLTQSKSLRSTSLILGGIGGAAIVSGFIIRNVNVVPDAVTEYQYRRKSSGGLLIAAGTATVVTSIFLHGSSRRYAKKAMQIELKNVDADVLGKNGLVRVGVPSVSFQFPL